MALSLLFRRIPKKSAIDRRESLLDVADILLDWEEPVNGYTCLAALLLDDKGCLDIKSYVATSFIFGLECLEKKQPVSDVSEKLLA